jgi:hypothetical protein
MLPRGRRYGQIASSQGICANLLIGEVTRAYGLAPSGASVPSNS